MTSPHYVNDVINEEMLIIGTCTGNLGNQEPTLESLSAWIPLDGIFTTSSSSNASGVGNEDHDKGNNDASERIQKRYDVIAIGMQEATFGTNHNQIPVVRSDRNLLLATDTSRLVLKGILASHLPSYKEIVEYQRGQMRLFVFVKNELYEREAVSDLSVSAENTGIGRVLNNKGGIVATFMLFQTRISFLSAHLQAHEGQGNYRRRCSSIKEILGGTKVQFEKKSRKHLKLYDASVTSHYMFVMGDLNFRTDFDKGNELVTNIDVDEVGVEDDEEDDDVDGDDEIEAITTGEEDATSNGEPVSGKVVVPARNFDAAMKLVDQKNWKALMAADELNYALQKHHALVGFKTPPCDFNPTFKVERNTGDFVYKNQRTPSYTDRILYKTMRGLEKHIEVVSYEPCPNYITSDHKPIRGTFAITPITPLMIRSTRRSSYRRSSSSYSRIIKFARKKLNFAFRLKLSKMKCTGVPAMDPNGLADPYILLILSSKNLHQSGFTNGIFGLRGKKWPRSSTILRNRSPDFGDETLEITVHTNSEEQYLGEMLHITVMDYDLASGDDLIGTISLNLYELYLSSRRSDGKCNEIKETIVKNGMPRGLFECELQALIVE